MLLRSIFAVCCTALPLAAGDFTLVGSDLLKAALEQPLAAAEATPGHTVRLRFDGSRGALDELRAGKADLACVVFAPDELPPQGEFRVVPLAYQVAVFAVTETNPVRQVSFAQLGGIFGEKEPTNHRQWGALGAMGPWEQKSISLQMVEDPDSLAVDLFRHTALNVPQLKPTILVQPSSAEMLRRVRVDDTCIGFFPRPLRDTAGVHVLLVARNDQDVPFGPTPENVHNGDYPLRLPFYLVFAPKDAAALAPLLDHLLGDTVAAALEAAGFVAVPANARHELLRTLGAR